MLSLQDKGRGSRTPILRWYFMILLRLIMLTPSYGNIHYNSLFGKGVSERHGTVIKIKKYEYVPRLI